MERREGERKITRKVPRVKLVEINLSNDGDGNRLRGAFPAEVVRDELVVRRVEPETRGQLQLRRHSLSLSHRLKTLSLYLSVCEKVNGGVWKKELKLGSQGRGGNI